MSSCISRSSGMSGGLGKERHCGRCNLFDKRNLKSYSIPFARSYVPKCSSGSNSDISIPVRTETCLDTELHFSLDKLRSVASHRCKSYYSHTLCMGSLVDCTPNPLDRRIRYRLPEIGKNRYFTFSRIFKHNFHLHYCS